MLNASLPVRSLAWLALLLVTGQAFPTICRAGNVETVTFAGNIAGDTRERVTVKAQLFLPDAAGRVLSAVIITPSSAGIQKEREIYYAQQLSKAGIAALLIDSFGSRGLTTSVYDQRLLDEWESENDAVAGLRWLAADERFRTGPIGIMGVSKGGTVARDTALEVRRKWLGVTDLAFAAHVAVSPDCSWINRSTVTTGAPILFMLAELDDQTPAAACVDYAERMRGAGNADVEVRIYYGAHHGWEKLGEKPLFDPFAENYSRCRVWVEDDGTMVTANTGAPVPERGWHAWAKRTCMTLGTHCCGGTIALRQRATEDLIAFLKKHNF